MTAAGSDRLFPQPQCYPIEAIRTEILAWLQENLDSYDLEQAICFPLNLDQFAWGVFFHNRTLFHLRSFASQKDLKKCLWAARYLAQRGFSVPQYVADGQLCGEYVLLEHLAGFPIWHDSLDDRVSNRVMTEIAGLHQHQSGRGGRCSRWGYANLAERLVRRLLRQIPAVTRLFPEFFAYQPRLIQWLEEWASNSTPRLYQLVHGECYPNNLVQSDQNPERIVLAGLRLPTYGFGELDLLDLLHCCCGEATDCWSGLLEDYQSAGGSISCEYLCECPLHVVYHLFHSARLSAFVLNSDQTAQCLSRAQNWAFYHLQQTLGLLNWEPLCLEIDPVEEFPAAGLVLVGAD